MKFEKRDAKRHRAVFHHGNGNRVEDWHTLAMCTANSSEWFDYREYAQYLRAPTLIYVGSKEPWVNELVELSQQ